KSLEALFPSGTIIALQSRSIPGTRPSRKDPLAAGGPERAFRPGRVGALFLEACPLFPLEGASQMLSTLRRLLTPRTRRPSLLVRRAFRPRLESLEDRTVPSVNWISTTSGDWADGTNWSSGSQPGANDDVVINVSGVTVTHSSGNDSVHSLTNSS